MQHHVDDIDKAMAEHAIAFVVFLTHFRKIERDLISKGWKENGAASAKLASTEEIYKEFKNDPDRFK